MFEDAVSHLMSEPRSSRPWSPAVDIFETDNEIVLRADLPDVELKDIDVRIENQTLTLKGERKFEKSEGNKGFHRIERSFGSFVRSFAVPATLETEKVTAEFKNGVLTIRLPIKEAAKPKQVKVEVKS
jgi:HSP20 family protein